jgi:hypothetical protein
MNQKYISALLALLFVLNLFTYTVQAEDDEEEEYFPECSWNNPCYISITDGDFDDPETNNTDEGGSNVGFNIEDPNEDNQVRGHLLDWLVPESYCDWYQCYYAYYYQATRDYFNKSGVGMQFNNMSGMYNFRAALEQYGYEISDVSVTNSPRTLGNDTRGDDDGIIEEGEDWEYDSDSCIEWRIYSGGEYVVRVDGKPIVSTNPERYVHYQDYSEMNDAQDCEANDGQGDDNITMWGEGDFSDMEIVADIDDDIASALAYAYQLDVGDYQVKYSYDSQTVHTKMDEEIRRDDVEEEGSNYEEIALEYLADDNCTGSNCDFIQMGYYTINVSADYPAACDFGNEDNSPCSHTEVGSECEDPSSGSCFEDVLLFCDGAEDQVCQDFIWDWYNSLITFVCGFDESPIPFYFVNDGIWDCPLGADEQQYDGNGEPINWFDCVDGTFVWIYQVNDGTSDCANGEDEGLNPDTDNDGILNNSDVCPETEEDSDVDNNGCAANQRDSDNDGLTDAEEEEIGTNPNDPDTDADGLNDSEEVSLHDTNPNTADSDGDGLLDGEEVLQYGTDPNDADTDGDGTNDTFDAFPLDNTEWIDTDNDGIGNNMDNDDDGDQISDIEDSFPLDNTESSDMDDDGVGDNSDLDIDGDGVENDLDAFPLDSSESADSDGDGIGDNSDAYPNDSNQSIDAGELPLIIHLEYFGENGIAAYDTGFYVHTPQTFNADVYTSEDGDILYYYYGSNCNEGFNGNWRTTSTLISTNPSSPEYGMGLQYPQRCVDPAIRYVNLTHNENLEWDITFYYSLEELGGSCPDNSSSFPVCTCNTGYSGNLAFDEANMAWMGSCVESGNVEEPVDNENNSTESNDTTLLDEENEVPGFGFIAVLISLLTISFFRRRK